MRLSPGGDEARRRGATQGNWAFGSRFAARCLLTPHFWRATVEMWNGRGDGEQVLWGSLAPALSCSNQKLPRMAEADRAGRMMSPPPSLEKRSRVLRF